MVAPLFIPPILMAGASAQNYIINGSGLFDGATGYLSRTPSVAGNRRTWVLEMIFKRSALGITQQLFTARSDGNNTHDLSIQSNGKLFWQDYDLGVATPAWRFDANFVLNDSGAYCHLILAVDTTQATAVNRCRAFLNGVQLTDWSVETQPSLNYESAVGINTTNPHRIGNNGGSTVPNDFFDGYIARVALYDGLSIADPASAGMGENTPDGYWRINDVSKLNLDRKASFTPSSSGDYTGNTGAFTIGSGTLDRGTGANVAILSVKELIGDFELSFTWDTTTANQINFLIAPTTHWDSNFDQSAAYAGLTYLTSFINNDAIGFQCANANTIAVFDSVGQTNPVGNLATNDRIKITRVGSLFRLYKNETLHRTINTTLSTEPMKVAYATSSGYGMNISQINETSTEVGGYLNGNTFLLEGQNVATGVETSNSASAPTILNPNDYYTGGSLSLSNGNKTLNRSSATGPTWQGTRTTQPFRKKVYFEILHSGINDGFAFVTRDASLATFPFASIQPDAGVQRVVNYAGVDVTPGDMPQYDTGRTKVAVDPASGEVWVGRVGTGWFGSGDPATGVNPVVTDLPEALFGILLLPNNAGTSASVYFDHADCSEVAPGGFGELDSKHFKVSGTVTATNDSPTDSTALGVGNFAHGNPVSKYAASLSNGNRTITASAVGYIEPVNLTFAFDVADADGFYCELGLISNAAGGHGQIGWGRVTANEIQSPDGSAARYVGQSADSWSYYPPTGQKRTNAVNLAYGASSTSGDRLGLLAKGGKLYIRKNGTWLNSGDPDAGTGFMFDGLAGDVVLQVGGYNTSVMTIYADPNDWNHSPPVGAKAIATQNMPSNNVNPSEHAGVLLYKGKRNKGGNGGGRNGVNAGGGGQGGGASSVQKNGTVMALAAGGGGGGGGGFTGSSLAGGAGGAGNGAGGAAGVLNGGPGISSSNGGGGGGGGGSQANDGMGGGTTPGGSGNGGSNILHASTRAKTNSSGAGTVPSNTGDADYTGSVGVGGVATGGGVGGILDTGENGLVVIEFLSKGTKTSYNAEPRYYVNVPIGETSVRVKCWGGGGSSGGDSTVYAGGNGGAGGFVQAEFDVAPGDVLTITVGEGGGLAGDTDLEPFSFQPDFALFMERTSTSSHQLFTSAIGAGQYIRPDTTDPLTAFDASQMNAFLPKGVRIGASNGINEIDQDYFLLCLNAGGAAVANNDGTIAAQVSANPTLGFSIVKVPAGTHAGGTIGHGLPNDPALIIGKPLTTVSNWPVYCRQFANHTDYLHLDDTSGLNPGPTNRWSATPADNSVIRLGSWTGWNDELVFYCFAETDIIKIGSYTGNGSADGPFVSTGHESGLLLVKNSSGVGRWLIYDNQRDPFNEAIRWLAMDDSMVEQTSINVDLLSNGFKPRNTSANINGSGNTYIYMSIAAKFIQGGASPVDQGRGR